MTVINKEETQSWTVIGRIVMKAVVLFVLCNASFALAFPLDTLGRLSFYNVLFQGRQRLPYGENPAESYSLSLNNLSAMLASHTLTRPKAADEFRVVLLGDSGVWGWFLENEKTLAGQLNAAGLKTADGRRVVVYNLGYPIMSLTKDVLILDAALQYEPDLILWPVTLESFPREKQLVPPLVQHNPGRVRALIRAHGLRLDPYHTRFVEPNFWERTLIGQRRPLADLLRLQLYAVPWAATGIDQAIPAEIPLRKSDFEPDVSWQTHEEPTTLTAADLAFDVLAAGVERAGDVPVIIVNEPIFISRGENSHLRYNAWYPRWAYDQYRSLLAETAEAHNWRYTDLWDLVAPQEFTDSPVHLSPEGTKLFTVIMAKEQVQNIINQEQD